MPDFIHATASARINGYIKGYGKFANLSSEFGHFAWPKKKQKEILAFIKERDL